MRKNVAQQNIPTITLPFNPAPIVISSDSLSGGDRPNISRGALFKRVVFDSARFAFVGGMLPGLLMLLADVFYALFVSHVHFDAVIHYLETTFQSVFLVLFIASIGAIIGAIFGVILGAITCWVFYPLRNPSRYRAWASVLPLLLFVFMVFVFADHGSLFAWVLCLLEAVYALWATQRIAVQSVVSVGLSHDPSYRAAPRVIDPYMSETRLALFDMAPGLADPMERLAGLGMLARWRGALLARLDMRPGMHAVDLMAGTGAMSRALVRRVGAGNVTAVEFAPSVAARLRGVAGVAVVEADALASGLPSGGADVVTCAFGTLGMRQHDHARLADEIDRLLAPNGVVGMVDMTLPRNPGLRWAYLLYLRSAVPLVARLFLERPALYEQLHRYARESAGLVALVGVFEARGYTVSLAPLDGGLATALVAMKPNE